MRRYVELQFYILVRAQAIIAVMTTNTTPAYSLRPACFADLPAVASAVGHEKFPRDLPLAGIHARGELESWYEKKMAQVADGIAHILAIDVAGGGTSIGQVTLQFLPPLSVWNLSYWLHPDYWGCGFTSSAVRDTLDLLYRNGAIDEVRAGVTMHNSGSIRVLQRAGLRQLEKASDFVLQSPFPPEIAVTEFVMTLAEWKAAARATQADRSQPWK